MKTPSKSVPKFASENEEREFWEQQDSSDYLDWNQAEPVATPNLKPTIKAISHHLP